MSERPGWSVSRAHLLWVCTGSVQKSRSGDLSWVQSCALVIFRHTAPRLSERGQVGGEGVPSGSPVLWEGGVPLLITAGELCCSSLSPGSHQGLVQWQAMLVSLSSRSSGVGPRPQDHVPFGIGATTYFLCKFVCAAFPATRPPS